MIRRIRKTKSAPSRASLTSIVDRAWQRRARALLKRLTRRAAGMAELKRLRQAIAPPWSIDFALVDQPTMRELNWLYRQKRRPTDVLSFPAPRLRPRRPLPGRPRGYLGELVICLPVMKRQAREQGHRPETELKILLVHGLLHLLGLDHEKSRTGARRMARLEAELLDLTRGHSRASGLIARAHNATTKGQ